jgi:predicted metal-dependent peptidase
MSDKAAERKVRAARGKVSFLRPYFSHGVFSLVLVESERCPTMAVDIHKRLYFNPGFVRRHDVGQLCTVILHELGHVLRGHHARARSLGVTSMTHHIANCAQDAELNDDLRDEAEIRGDISPLPEGAIYPSRFGCPDHKPWEYYYMHARDNCIVVAVGSDGNVSTGGSSADEAEGHVIPMPHDCGSGAHGVSRPWELGDPATSGAEGVSDADWRDVQRLTAEAIADRQRTRGDVPAGWTEWASDLLRPRTIPWDQELSSGLRWAIHDVAGDVLHSYRRPSRRQSASPDIILPSMRSPRPFVCVVGDTSGSMDATDLAYVRGVVRDICLAMNARIAFLATDADVHEGVQLVQDGRDITLAGRGGTDMRVGIEYALSRLRPRPDVLVVISDCETPWPDKAPLIRTIVCAIGNSSDIQKVPSWARLIRVDPRVGTRPEPENGSMNADGIPVGQEIA